MHGQYEYRSNLDPYYETLAAAGIEATGIAADEMKDVFTYYAAMTLDFDKAIGIMFDYLENTSDSDGVPLLDKTIITVFGDHNAYYQTLSPYVKNLFLDDENGRNYTDLFRVPLMIHVGGVSENMPKEERLITKFTTTTDIIPTVLDLLGINYYNSLYYGHNLLAEEESIIYSRAYNVFITDKLYFTSINNIKFATPDVNDEYISTITEKALTLLDKTSHVNRIFYYDFLSGDRADTFYAKLKSMQN